MAALTSQDLVKITRAAYKRINDKRMKKIDRTKRPWLEFLEGKKKTTTFEGGAIVYPVQITAGVNGQTWTGDDEIEAVEPDFQLNLEYGYFNYTNAITIKHDQLFRLGYSIVPNGQGTIDGRSMSKDQAYKIINYVESLVESQRDDFDRRLDQLMLLPGTASPADPVGLFGIITTTPATGTVGGLSRVDYAQVRHQYDASAAAIAAGSDFRVRFTQIMRQANLFSHGNGIDGKVDVIFAGSYFMDQFTKWAELNNYQRQITPAMVKKLDIAIPDTALQFEEVPIVHCPTFDTLASLGLVSNANKFAVGVNSGTWHYKVLSGRDKVLTTPMDPPKQRVTRQDIDLTAHLACDAPASNFLYVAP